MDLNGPSGHRQDACWRVACQAWEVLVIQEMYTTGAAACTSSSELTRCTQPLIASGLSMMRCGQTRTCQTAWRAGLHVPIVHGRPCGVGHTASASAAMRVLPGFQGGICCHAPFMTGMRGRISDSAQQAGGGLAGAFASLPAVLPGRPLPFGCRFARFGTAAEQPMHVSLLDEYGR